MNIVIADDERLVRQSLADMIRELGAPWKLIGETANGRELISLIERVKPDLAFVDIKMPGMNGLEAMREARKLVPDTEWVVLTGYSEFAYAKEALQLGAANYLLKPAGIEELADTLNGVRNRREQARAALGKAFDNDVVSLFCAPVSLRGEKGYEQLADYRFSSTLYYVDSGLEEGEKAARAAGFYQRLKDLAQRHSDGEARFTVFYSPAGQLVSVAAWRTATAMNGRVASFLEQVERLLAECSDDRFAVTAVSSASSSSYWELVRLTEELGSRAGERVTKGVGRRLTFRANGTPAETGVWLAFGNLWIALAQSYHERDFALYCQTLEELFTCGIGTFAGLTSAQLEAVRGFAKASLHVVFPNRWDAAEWREVLKRKGEQLLLSSKSQSSSLDVVSYVKRMVETRYMEELTIVQLAEELGVTPNYLSSRFHKLTKMTFMKYLTQYRIIKAQELLADPQTKVQQAAEKVGYFSTRHFTKRFLEHVGEYPSDYKKKFV